MESSHYWEKVFSTVQGVLVWIMLRGVFYVIGFNLLYKLLT